MKNPPMIRMHRTASHIAPPLLLQSLLDLRPRLDVSDVLFDAFDDHFRLDGNREPGRYSVRASTWRSPSELERYFPVNFRTNAFGHTSDVPLQHVARVVDVVFRHDTHHFFTSRAAIERPNNAKPSARFRVTVATLPALRRVRTVARRPERRSERRRCTAGDNRNDRSSGGMVLRAGRSTPRIMIRTASNSPPMNVEKKNDHARILCGRRRSSAAMMPAMCSTSRRF